LCFSLSPTDSSGCSSVLLSRSVKNLRYDFLSSTDGLRTGDLDRDRLEILRNLDSDLGLRFRLRFVSLARRSRTSLRFLLPPIVLNFCKFSMILKI
jgi:hypothetical protein